MVFSFAQIAVCAVVSGLASTSVLALYWGRRGDRELVRAGLVGLAVAAATALWRAAGNTPALNEDPIPWVSPNDVLSPVVTYVVAGMFASLTGIHRRADWPASHAFVTVVAFVVNVLTI